MPEISPDKIYTKSSIFWIVISVPIGVFLVLSAYAYLNQSNMIYFPDNQSFEDCPGFYDSNNVRIGNTRMYHGGLSDTLVAFYHGNAGSACDRSHIKNVLKNAGLSWLFVEYTGYSGDYQKPSRDLILKNAEQADKFIQSVDPEKTVIIGSSLGAAVAAYHGSNTRADKLILMSPFNKLSELGKNHYPYLPVELLLKEEYETDKWVGSFPGDLLILHGTTDNIVPIELGRKVFEAATTENKEFVEIEGAGHNNMWSHPETKKAILDFIK